MPWYLFALQNHYNLSRQGEIAATLHADDQNSQDSMEPKFDTISPTFSELC